MAALGSEEGELAAPLIPASGPIATDDALTASRRFRRIADFAGPASSPGPVATDTREPQDGTWTASSKRACAGPGSAQSHVGERPVFPRTGQPESTSSGHPDCSRGDALLAISPGEG